jgi:hypothetical protein
MFSMIAPAKLVETYARGVFRKLAGRDKPTKVARLTGALQEIRRLSSLEGYTLADAAQIAEDGLANPPDYIWPMKPEPERDEVKEQASNVRIVYVLTQRIIAEDIDIVGAFSSESAAMDYRDAHASRHDALLDDYEIASLVLDPPTESD